MNGQYMMGRHIYEKHDGLRSLFEKYKEAIHFHLAEIVPHAHHIFLSIPCPLPNIHILQKHSPLSKQNGAKQQHQSLNDSPISIRCSLSSFQNRLQSTFSLWNMLILSWQSEPNISFSSTEIPDIVVNASKSDAKITLLQINSLTPLPQSFPKTHIAYLLFFT